MEIPQLIIDLALMMTTAALVTLIFRKLKIPAILGYILAGFLIGPNFPYFMDVASESSIEILSEIGVVIILFHIGLEFDFNKLSEIGSTAIVSAAVKMGGVMLAGYGFGLALGMTTMDSIYLGAMLSISSTVVIQKCFDELDLNGEKYTKLVLGSLVMEDVIAVFMMVVLTTVAASKQSSGMEMAVQMLIMLAYLILWLVLGIFLLPTFLDRAMNLMSDETLTILSVGFCFLMGILAHVIGFSMELGAFIAGSLFAGTRHVHEVERVTMGIKDMFGAIFFLSVGMMVQPEIIATRWTSIVPIAFMAVTVKLIFATIGMMLSGQDIDTSLRGGISLAPIGEFSFIIASLGISLGVIDEYLYPVIVASSILTIMMTPIQIRHSDRIARRIKAVLPPKLRKKLDEYTSNERSEEEHSSEWTDVLKEFFAKTTIYGGIMLAAEVAGSHIIYPLLKEPVGDMAAKIIATAIIYSFMAFFLMPYMGRRSLAFTHLWMDKLSNRPSLVAIMLIKVAILEGIGLFPLIAIWGVRNPILLLLIPVTVLLLARSEFITTFYLKLEAKFFANLNQKTMEERGGERSHQNWLNEDYSIFGWFIPEGAPYEGKSIIDLQWGRKYSVYVVRLKRGKKRTVLPPARTVIQVGDKVHVIGDRRSLEVFSKTLGVDKEVNIRTLKDFMDGDYEHIEAAIACMAIKVRGTENYVGKTIKNSGLASSGHCMVLGVERDGYATKMPDANMLIEEGDILWLIGTNFNLSKIASQSVGEFGKHEGEDEAV